MHERKYVTVYLKNTTYSRSGTNFAQYEILLSAFLVGLIGFRYFETELIEFSSMDSVELDYI
ncbi:hypothetical protein J1N35_033047 [Gossypium stocksii]|uniref:Uncharacterized protein n=1 Tax=Gossypium stocksii TaxID=47602 RepID=A0A9D3ZP36_9ROSI|nr:hypothetical protein J1N35_033047 [Gossypium stocksii]